MKLLHTGDMHLGKNLHEAPLIEDQKYMLNNLMAELARDSYAALILAGDVYDRTIPSAEAVELFSSFLVDLRHSYPELDICVIPGNHDSARRLSYADRILGEQHIHIICNPENSFTPIILSKNGERLAIWLLPFLAPGTLRPEAVTESNPAERNGNANQSPELDFSRDDERILISQADLAAEAARHFSSLLSTPEYAGYPSILVAHLFTLSGKSSESERIFLGTAEKVDPELFHNFAYVALGHLHRSQKVTERMYYAGSPLAYAFDEAGTEKKFLKVEIDCKSTGFPVQVTPIPIQPLHRVSRVSGRFDDFYTGTQFDSYADDFLEINLTDENLVVNPMNLLRPKFPNLLSLRQGMTEGSGTQADVPAGSVLDSAKSVNTEKRNPVEDFCRFEERLYGNVDQDRKELFSSLLSECANET